MQAIPILGQIVAPRDGAATNETASKTDVDGDFQKAFHQEISQEGQGDTGDAAERDPKQADGRDSRLEPADRAEVSVKAASDATEAGLNIAFSQESGGARGSRIVGETDAGPLPAIKNAANQSLPQERDVAASATTNAKPTDAEFRPEHESANANSRQFGPAASRANASLLGDSSASVEINRLHRSSELESAIHRVANDPGKLGKLESNATQIAGGTQLSDDAMVQPQGASSTRPQLQGNLLSQSGARARNGVSQIGGVALQADGRPSKSEANIQADIAQSTLARNSQQAGRDGALERAPSLDLQAPRLGDAENHSPTRAFAGDLAHRTQGDQGAAAGPNPSVNALGGAGPKANALETGAPIPEGGAKGGSTVGIGPASQNMSGAAPSLQNGLLNKSVLLSANRGGAIGNPLQVDGNGKPVSNSEAAGVAVRRIVGAQDSQTLNGSGSSQKNQTTAKSNLDALTAGAPRIRASVGAALDQSVSAKSVRDSVAESTARPSNLGMVEAAVQPPKMAKPAGVGVDQVAARHAAAIAKDKSNRDEAHTGRAERETQGPTVAAAKSAPPAPPRTVTETPISSFGAEGQQHNLLGVESQRFSGDERAILDSEFRVEGLPRYADLSSISTSTPRPLVDLRAAHQITQQIASVLNPLPDGMVEISLKPEELGQLRMMLSMNDGTLHVSLAAERSETADLIRRHLDLLSQEFKNLGYTDISFDFGDRGQDAQDRQHDGVSRSEIAPDDDALNANSIRRVTNADGGVDLRL